jgi:hypothetical protein
MGRRPPPERPSILDDEEDDLTVADELPDLTHDAQYDTPITARRCARCGCLALLGGPDDFAGGLPAMCAVSKEDGRWRFCATEREVTYKLRDGDPQAWEKRQGTPRPVRFRSP